MHCIYVHVINALGHKCIYVHVINALGYSQSATNAHHWSVGARTINSFQPRKKSQRSSLGVGGWSRAMICFFGQDSLHTNCIVSCHGGEAMTCYSTVPIC